MAELAAASRRSPCPACGARHTCSLWEHALSLTCMYPHLCACPQNFDDVKNWAEPIDGKAPILSSSPPTLVKVGNKRTKAEPINIKVKEGNEYTMGEIEIAEGLTLTLDVDAEIIFDDRADGDEATFVGGQVSKMAHAC